MWSELISGPDRRVSSGAVSRTCAGKNWDWGEAKAAKGGNTCEKFCCNWAVANGISRRRSGRTLPAACQDASSNEGKADLLAGVEENPWSNAPDGQGGRTGGSRPERMSLP